MYSLGWRGGEEAAQLWCDLTPGEGAAQLWSGGSATRSNPPYERSYASALALLAALSAAGGCGGRACAWTCNRPPGRSTTHRRWYSWCVGAARAHQWTSSNETGEAGISLTSATRSGLACHPPPVSLAWDGGQEIRSSR